LGSVVLLGTSAWRGHDRAGHVAILVHSR
jgi:hypothetical protein